MRVERLRDLVARLHAMPRRRLTLLVGVDGPRGAGKTTFTRALAALDPGLDVVHMEDFALPPALPAQAPPGRFTGEVDWRRLRGHVLLPLSRDQPARYQRYDPGSGALAEWRMVPVGGILIVEGLYACARPLAGFYDFRVCVDAPREVRLRRAGRDGGGRLLAEEPGDEDGCPEAPAHLRVDGSGALPHDLATEYVRR